MLSIQSLALSIKDELLFHNISIVFLPSAIIYIQGRNGTGKTSLLRIIAGIQNPTSGTITFGPSLTPIASLKSYCTYIGHKLAIKQDMSVLDHLLFWAKLHGAHVLLPTVIHYLNLAEILYTKCYELSEGVQKRVALSRLIICPSKLWLLDEIDYNLDNHSKHLLNTLIVSHADSGGIVLLTSHTEPTIKSAQILQLHDYQPNKL